MERCLTENTRLIFFDLVLEVRGAQPPKMTKREYVSKIFVPKIFEILDGSCSLFTCRNTPKKEEIELKVFGGCD